MPCEASKNGYPGTPEKGLFAAPPDDPAKNPLAEVKLVNSVLELPTCHFRPLDGNRKITHEDVARSGLLGAIRQDGQQVPGLCARDSERPGENRWVIVAGNSRWLCCDILNVPFRFLPVEGDTSPQRLVKLSLTDNVIRKNLSLLEMAEQIEQFRELAQLETQAQIAAALGIGESEISRALALPKRLAPSLHQHIRNFEIGRTFAEMIAVLPTHELQETAAKHYLSFPHGKRPKRVLFQHYLDGINPKAKKAKAGPKKMEFNCCGVKGSVRGGAADAVKAVKALHVKLTEVFKSEAFKQIEKEPELAMVLLPSLLKS